MVCSEAACWMQAAAHHKGSCSHINPSCDGLLRPFARLSFAYTNFPALVQNVMQYHSASAIPMLHASDSDRVCARSPPPPVCPKQ